MSAGFEFISLFISAWGDMTAEPPIMDPKCADMGGFFDVRGVEYNCMWYEREDHCVWYGDYFAHVGFTANSACCICGGGTS